MTEAQELLAQQHYSIIFLDIELEQQNNGIDFAKMLQISDPDISLVYITAHIKEFRGSYIRICHDVTK